MKLDKKTLDENLKKSLRIVLYLFEVANGRNFVPKIKSINTHSTHSSVSDSYTIYFETEYEISLDDPDVTELSSKLINMEKKHFQFFKNFELNQQGELTKQTIDFNMRDDMVGLLYGLNYDRENWKVIVTFSNEYNLYFDN
jgi:hypothetical protein